VAACGPSTVNQGSVGDASGKAPAADGKPANNDTPTWDKRYTWSSGMTVEIAAPVECKPGEFAQPKNIQRAVLFKVTVINDTDKPYETTVLTYGGSAQFDGAAAESIVDLDGPCGAGAVETATIMPGKTYSYSVAYAVGQKPGEMQLTMTAELAGDKAVFVGQA
jgi:hypothetical protein